MTSRNPCGLAAILLVIATASGCDESSSGTATSAATSAAPPPAEAYNADQLTQALLTDIPGYERSGAPQWGQYSSLAAVQNSVEMQQSIKLDKPQCASPMRAVSEKAVQNAPSALIAFVKGRRQSVSEILMAVGPDVAAQQVRYKIPPACRSLRAKVGGRWSAITVTEPGGPHIGEGARTVGVTTTTNGVPVHTWFVVLRSRGYLATITLYGPGAEQGEAERLARRAYQQAERILP